MNHTLRIGPLQGGGLVLGYRCSARCRHCLYGCGPHRRDGEPAGSQVLDALLDELAARAPRARYHIGGGEPFLDVDRLAHAISGLRRRGMALDYVETNASWARSEEHAAHVLEELERLGLGCVLVSLSPFHAEHVAPSRTLALIRAAERCLPAGAFVWIPDFASDLEEAPPDGRLDLDELLARRGERYARGLATRYGLVAAGRAGRYLAASGQREPWEVAAGRARCRARLEDTSHFHVDGAGQYVPGLCAGLVLPLSELPGEIDLSRYALLRLLVTGGPRALCEHAIGLGFVPDGAGYSSPCDACTHVRRFLWPRGYPELGPDGFYDPRSVSGYPDDELAG